MRAAPLTILTILTALQIGAWSMAIPARAQVQVRRILVVHNADSHDPARGMVDAGILAAVRAAGSDAVDFSFEYVDLQRFASEADADMLARQLGQKYAGVGVRAIVAVTDGALAFLRKHELFHDVPTVAFTEGRPPVHRLNAEPNVVRIWAGPTAVATIELALRLHPSTRQVVVLSGKPYNDGEYEREVRAQLEVFRGRVDVTFLTDPEPEQALAAVKALPPDALVLFLRLVETPRGNRDSREAGVMLSNLSPVPFYTVKDTRVGYGAVGGFVGDTTATGFRVGTLAIRLASGTPPGDIPSEQERVVPMFDWRQLQRWRISESQLPAGSAILHRPPGAWQLYRRYLVVGGLVLGIQTSLIGALLLQRKRRRRTELALLESQRRYALATGAGALGVWDWNFETGDLYVDPVLKSLLGFGDAEITSRPEDWGARVHPQDASAAAARIKACIDGDSETYEIEHRMVHKDGSAKWFLSRGSAIRRADGTLHRLVGTKVDVTERKRAEEMIRESEAALQVSYREIQHLAGRLIEAQDAERARIARDLHDDVSQQLAALSISVSGLKHRVVELPGSADVQRDLRTLQQRTVTLTESVRHLSHDLHPTVLQHVGLVAALTQHCAELSNAHGVVVTCTAEGDFEGLPPDAALCFYRIAQEALRNVVAHAGASAAEVQLRRMGESGELTIADDGQGFALAGSPRSGKGLGLVSITERVRLAGGTLSVVSELNKGTRLRVQIPVGAPARCVV